MSRYYKCISIWWLRHVSFIWVWYSRLRIDLLNMNITSCCSSNVDPKVIKQSISVFLYLGKYYYVIGEVSLKWGIVWLWWKTMTLRMQYLSKIVVMYLAVRLISCIHSFWHFKDMFGFSPCWNLLCSTFCFLNLLIGISAVEYIFIWSIYYMICHLNASSYTFA